MAGSFRVFLPSIKPDTIQPRADPGVRDALRRSSRIRLRNRLSMLLRIPAIVNSAAIWSTPSPTTAPTDPGSCSNGPAAASMCQAGTTHRQVSRVVPAIRPLRGRCRSSKTRRRSSGEDHEKASASESSTNLRILACHLTRVRTAGRPVVTPAEGRVVELHLVDVVDGRGDDAVQRSRQTMPHLTDPHRLDDPPMPGR